MQPRILVMSGQHYFTPLHYTRDSVIDATWRGFLTFLCFLLGFLAVVTNGTIIGVFLNRRRVLRPMHCYLFSDCITNILTGAQLLIIGYLLSTDNVTSCYTQFLLEGMLIIILVTGFLSIVTIAMERYRAIVLLRSPLSAAQRRAIILIIWSIAIIFMSVHYIYIDVIPRGNLTNVPDISIQRDCWQNKTTSAAFNSTSTGCPVACFVKLTHDTIATTILFLIFYLLPASASIFLYARVVQQLWKRRQMGSIGYQEKKRQAINAMVYILAIFITCWFPFFIYRFSSVWMGYSTTSCVYNSFLLSAYILGCSESAISALIYISYSHDFRKAFCHVLRLLRPKKIFVGPSPVHISCNRLDENSV